MDDYAQYYEARQHLNLSQVAFEVVEHDKYEFQDKPSFTRMLNRIFEMYRDCANASITPVCDAYQEHVEKQLEGLTCLSEKNAVAATLRAAYRKELIETANSYPREHPFKVQLNRENYAYISDWMDPENAYDGIPGRYIKAVIEEYARKPLVEREKIIFREFIDLAEGCIAAQRAMIITLRGNDRYEVKPYSICVDKGYNYNYLVGLSRKAGTQQEEKISSFRLSKIGTYKSSGRSGRITDAQKKELEQKLQSVGVQFLLLDPEIIRVKLTDHGRQMYETQAHLRPAFRSRSQNSDGTWTYEFLCAHLQAQFYFFRFGSDAEVLFPAGLRSLFKTMYMEALEKYGV